MSKVSVSARLACILASDARAAEDIPVDLGVNLLAASTGTDTLSVDVGFHERVSVELLVGIGRASEALDSALSA